MPTPNTKKLLALDLATQTGWARLANGVIDHGSEDFSRYTGCKSKPADHLGKSYLKLFLWLKVRIFEDKPDAIIYEEPAGRFKNRHAQYIAVGMRGILFMVAAHYNVKIIPYAPSKIKNWAAGHGFADKDMMKAAAIKLSNGDTFADDNAADAYLLLQYYIAKGTK